MIYVLMAKMETGDQRPVAVVDDETIANQWTGLSADHDWIPFQLNDLHLTSLSSGVEKPFVPETPTQENADKVHQNLQEAQRLLKQELERRKRVKSHARRAAMGIQPMDILNGYLEYRQDRDPYIDDFLRYVKRVYRTKLPEPEYIRMENATRELYLKTFGPK
jgi:DNA repair ATPase RecN